MRMHGHSTKLTRRGFLAAGILAAAAPRALAEATMAKPLARPITTGPNHHFFGYYEKCPWDRSGRYHLAMEVPFIDRMPKADDVLTAGMIDLAEGNRFQPLAQTTAWCWQMGTMLRWLPGAEDRLITYNIRKGDGFAAAIRDVQSGEERQLPLPIYTISPDGRYALTLNFARLGRLRPGYGYEAQREPWAGEKHPAQDGIWRMDMNSGEARLLFSYDQAAATKPKDSMKDAEHWFNHIQINTDGTRFAFLHRWKQPGAKSWETRTWTLSADGADPYVIADDGYWSHYDWRDRDHLIAHAAHGPKRGYFLFTDRTDKAEPIADGVLTTDGHCSFPPDRRWMLTDTYPDRERMRTLILYRMADGKRVDIGRFFAPPQIDGPMRCDLHPRWSRDGRQVSIDSAHEGARQIYVLDVSSVTAT